MTWLQRLIRHFLPRDRYHELNNKVGTRQMRVELLNKRLAVIERRGQPR